jgi:hypothetical protein
MDYAVACDWGNIGGTSDGGVVAQAAKCGR